MFLKVHLYSTHLDSQFEALTVKGLWLRSRTSGLHIRRSHVGFSKFPVPKGHVVGKGERFLKSEAAVTHAE